MRRSSETAARGKRFLAGALCFLVAAGTAPAAGQSLETNIERLGAENAELYLRPVTSGLGAALNTGFFHTAAVQRPLGFDLSVRAMGAFFPRDAEEFTPVLPSELTYRGTTYQDPYVPADGRSSSPTAVGEGPGMVAEPAGAYRQDLLAAGEDPDDFAIHFPAGEDLPLVPFALAQASVGLPHGTEAALRFVPSISLGEEVGSVRLFGLGLRHGIDQWLPGRSPVSLSVSAGWQELRAGDYLELTARQLSLAVGRELSVLSVYGALGVESASARVSYVVDNRAANPALPEGGTRIAFEDEGENRARGLAGLTVHMGPVKLNAEYAAARYPVAAVKLLVGTR